MLIIIFIGIFSIFKVNQKTDKIKVVNKVKIGLCMDSLIIERWQIDRDVFMANAKELGADVIVQNAGSDSNFTPQEQALIKKMIESRQGRISKRNSDKNLLLTV